MRSRRRGQPSQGPTETGEWAVSTSFTSTQLAQNEVQYVHNRQMGALTVDIEDLTLTAEDITGNVGPAFIWGNLRPTSILGNVGSILI